MRLLQAGLEKVEGDFEYSRDSSKPNPWCWRASWPQLETRSAFARPNPPRIEVGLRQEAFI